MPTKTASTPLRMRIEYARARGPVIHFDSPFTVAILPSRVIAALTMTHGVLWRIQWFHDSLRRSAECARQPVITSMLAWRSRSIPLPLWRGFGSTVAMTTRLIPAAMIASVQGGVRPWVEHGSSVTYNIEPSGLIPLDSASQRASISACGWPARLCQPLPMSFPALTSTAPTIGFGEVRPQPFLARPKARRIQCTSQACCRASKFSMCPAVSKDLGSRLKSSVCSRPLIAEGLVAKASSCHGRRTRRSHCGAMGWRFGILLRRDVETMSCSESHGFEVTKAFRQLLFNGRRFVFDEVPLCAGLSCGAEQRRQIDLAGAECDVICYVGAA